MFIIHTRAASCLFPHKVYKVMEGVSGRGGTSCCSFYFSAKEQQLVQVVVSPYKYPTFVLSVATVLLVVSCWKAESRRPVQNPPTPPPHPQLSVSHASYYNSASVQKWPQKKSQRNMPPDLPSLVHAYIHMRPSKNYGYGPGTAMSSFLTVESHMTISAYLCS